MKYVFTTTVDMEVGKDYHVTVECQGITGQAKHTRYDLARLFAEANWVHEWHQVYSKAQNAG
jgi:hypothetical protein